MIYGYCRVSTKTQKLDRQIKNISEAYPEARIITEAFTGTKISRPAFDKLLKTLKDGDTLVFDSVSRMSRNAEEGFQLYTELYQKGITLVFLKESYINTDTYKQALTQSLQSTGNEIADIYIEATNRVLMILAEEQIKKAFEQAQKEVTDLHNRVKEGQKAAEARAIAEGRDYQKGAPAGMTYHTEKELKAIDIIKKHSKSFGGTLEDSEVITLCGCSRNSYYKYKRLASEMEER